MLQDALKRRLVRAGAGVLALLLALGWWYFRGGGDGRLAVAFAPQKAGSRATTQDARDAHEMFWRTLHGGRYDDIPATIEVMTRVFREHPDDPDMARRLGFLHAWWLLERNRLAQIPGTISDSAVLSQHYYDISQQLNPGDDRMPGLQAVLRMLNGLVLKDEKLTREGYFLGQEANRRFPQFNYFTTSVALATLPHTDPLFQESVDMQWKLLDSCGSWEDLARNPTPEEFAARNPGPKRVCWESWIAPHNMKGTLLHMGDILVKSGDWRKGVEIYQRIKSVHGYQDWPMKEFLEERIRGAEANVEHFRVDYTARLGEHITRPAMLVHSGYFCVSCHQAKGSIPGVPNFPALVHKGSGEAPARASP